MMFSIREVNTEQGIMGESVKKNKNSAIHANKYLLYASDSTIQYYILDTFFHNIDIAGGNC